MYRCVSKLSDLLRLLSSVSRMMVSSRSSKTASSYSSKKPKYERLRTIGNVDIVDLEEEVVLVVDLNRGGTLMQLKKCAKRCVETAVWQVLVKDLA